MRPLEIKNMNIIERLQTMEAIWDSFACDDSEIHSPEWHKSILIDRKRKIEDDSTEFISIKDLKENYKL